MDIRDYQWGTYLFILFGYIYPVLDAELKEWTNNQKINALSVMREQCRQIRKWLGIGDLTKPWGHSTGDQGRQEVTFELHLKESRQEINQVEDGGLCSRQGQVHMWRTWTSKAQGVSEEQKGSVGLGHRLQGWRWWHWKQGQGTDQEGKPSKDFKLGNGTTIRFVFL